MTPMDDAWSTLLKLDTPKTIASRRKQEERQHFRPSTGQFKTPPGGQSGGVGATMRRLVLVLDITKEDSTPVQQGLED